LSAFQVAFAINNKSNAKTTGCEARLEIIIGNVHPDPTYFFSWLIFLVSEPLKQLVFGVITVFKRNFKVVISVRKKETGI